MFLQIWRKHSFHENTYKLVDETYFKPTELRFQEVALERLQYIEIQKNDILGLYFREKNPIAWSMVPCSSLEQQYLYIDNPADIKVGRTYTFRKPKNPYQGCRHYSFSAVLGKSPSSNSHSTKYN